MKPNVPGEALRAALAASRLVIEKVSPCVDEGRHPSRSCVGRPLKIEATIFADGHDALSADLLWQPPGEDWQRIPMTLLGNDRWQTRVQPSVCGLHRYTIEAWIDGWKTYTQGLAKLHAADKLMPVDVQEGLALIRACVAGQPALQALAQDLSGMAPEAAVLHLLSDTTAQLMHAAQPRCFLLQYPRELHVDVERRAAGFASWYELFPRSASPRGDHGTFDDVIARLPAIAAMGFDVLYMPPIHPIGSTKRKGRNNALSAQPGDVGSPYAIGSAEGGHDSVHPQLGGIEAFRRLREAAAAQGLELALDFAIQCSPDHPWLVQHPAWFNWRADGSLRSAENPPKKYEDIVNVDFHGAEAPDLWQALRDVVQHWVNEGVRLFRVDNPHTKPLPFWEWLIADIRARHPDVVFLAEAFTRPAMMQRLAAIGFAQSYTYFTWRNHKTELAEYLTELADGPARAFYRPHFFVNTPDINPFFLHDSGRAGFLIRAALATTLSGLWGMYSGFELCESAPLPGKEEYQDSEKYELRPRNWNAPGNIIGEITRLNALRRENAALQNHLGVRFHHCDNAQVLFYSKHVEGEPLLLIAVNLDPHREQGTHLDVPLQLLDADEDSANMDSVIEVQELMSQQSLRWQGRRQHWHFKPWEMPFAIWRLRRVQN